jgi:hypothetical protein
VTHTNLTQNSSQGKYREEQFITMGKVEDKLKELDITIPTPPAPKGKL